MTSPEVSLPQGGPSDRSSLIAHAHREPRHRGLMVIYLSGGVDCHQLLSPRAGANRRAYEAARPGLALPDHPATALSADWQLHPVLTSLHAAWAAGQLGIVRNVGPLLQPVSAVDYRQRSKPLPPQLFSHSSQNSLWQAGDAGVLAPRTGWIGRLMELLHPVYSPAARLSPMLSFSGPQPSFGAETLRSLGLSQDGAEPRMSTRRISRDVVALAEQVMARMATTRDLGAGHPLAQEYARAQHRAAGVVSLINDALASVQVKTSFPALPALKTAARLFKADSLLGRRRSVHFLVHGGYDQHRELTSDLQERLKDLNAGLTAFRAALEELKLTDDVLTVVYSEFGRSLVQNASGTDHGWGGHVLLLGGGVRTGLHGLEPDLTRNSPDLVEARGLLLPSTATDQLMAELASWMGLPRDLMPSVLPNLGAFQRLEPLFA